MTELIFGSLVGIVAGMLHALTQTQSLLAWGRLLLRPSKKGKTQGFLRRARALFDRKNNWWLDFYLLLPLALLLPGPLWIAGKIWMVGVAVGYLLVVGGGRLVKVLDPAENRRRLVRLAKERVLEHGAPAEALAVFTDALAQGDQVAKAAAVEGLAWLGSKEARALLLETAADADSEVQAAAVAATEELDAALSGKQVLSTKNMAVFLEEIAYLEQELLVRPKADREGLLEKKVELEEIVDEIVFSQVALRNTYPDLFCDKCHTRADLHQAGRWKYVACRHCKDVHHLAVDVRQVVGRIGPFPERELVRGTLYLNLWDAAAQKARFADIHLLEIAAGGEFPYDWAVNAVVESLGNQAEASEYPFFVSLEEGVELEANTLNMLRGIGWEG